MRDFNDKDVEFIRAMIPHHIDAVKMGRAELDRGMSDEVKRWARAIFSGQSDEIEKFRDWLQARGLRENDDSMPISEMDKMAALLKR